MNPYLSWAIVFAVTGSLGWYYSSSNASKAKAKIPVMRTTTERAETPRNVKKQKRKSNKKSAEPSFNPTTETKEKPNSGAGPEPSKAEGYGDDEEIDGKEFAKRFAAVKTGALAPPAEPGSKAQKKNRKNKTNGGPATGERSASHVSTRASSTTGAEGDDDLSSNESPKVNGGPQKAGDVSDMLEAPTPKASVLRVTGSVESAEPKKQQKKETFKPAETKKQRQQRLKNEERKAQVKEAEQERRKLLEKQLHTAREAERRGVKSTTAPTTNAWAPKETKITAPTPNGTSSQLPKVDLLDTFDEATPELRQEVPAPRKWDLSIPTEEEQMQMLGVSSESEWTTVSNKKTKKRGGKGDDSVSESGGSDTLPTPSVPLSVVETEVTVMQTYIPDILRSTVKGHPLDSDWVA